MLANAVAVLLSILSLGSGVTTADRSTTHSHNRFGNCTHAVATLGPRDSQIHLRVDCWAPRRGGEFGFSVMRLGARGEAQVPGIRHFDRHPTITGSGAVSSHGRCRWGEGSLGCQARSRGAVTLHEEIRVRPGTRCSRRISITTSVTTCEPTVRRPCPASLTIAQLFDGPPRGC